MILSNNTTLTVQGSSHIQAVAKVHNKHVMDITLQDILYILDLAKNLLSTSWCSSATPSHSTRMVP